MPEPAPAEAVPLQWDAEAKMGPRVESFQRELNSISVESVAEASPDIRFVGEARAASAERLKELYVRAARAAFIRRTFSDQSMVVDLADAEKIALTNVVVRTQTEEDVENIAWLKDQIGEFGWFSIDQYGPEADEAAWSLVQNAELEPEWQAEMLEKLLPLMEAGETSRSQYAILFDQVAWRSGRPLRYGVLGRCTGPDSWEPFRLEDSPEKVEANRAAADLPPLAEYRAEAGAACSKFMTGTRAILSAPKTSVEGKAFGDADLP